MITYKLYISESDNVDTVENAEANGTLKDQGVDVTSLLADNLDTDTVYYYNVVAEDSVGKSVYQSNSQSTLAVLVPTQKPIIDSVDVQIEQAEVLFIEVDNATSYQFRVNEGNSSVVESNPFTIFNLQANTQYNVQVRGINTAGSGPWSDPFVFTTQQESTPTGTPTVTEVSHNLTSITASYTTISNVDGYEYRLNGSIITDIGFDNPFTITGLGQNTINTIEVRGYNDGGGGPWSNLITVTTDSEVVDQPMINSVDSTEDPVSIAFTGVDFASGYDYRINGGSAIDIGTTNPFEISLDGGTEYNVEIRGYNQYGKGPWSVVETFTTNYIIPTITTDTINTDGAVFTHTLVGGAVDYEISVDGGNFESIGTTGNYTITGKAQNQEFEHVVRAIYQEGVGVSSNLETTLTKISQPPTVTLSSLTTSSITINIEAIDGQSTVTYFARIDGGAYADVGIGDEQYTGLTNGQTYTFDVYAENASGDGPVTTIQFTTTDVPDKVVITNTIAGDNYIEVYFGEVANADYYEARVDLGTGEDIGTSSPGFKSGLSLNTTYLIQVRAVNNVTGAGAWSDAVEETTLAEFGVFNDVFNYAFN